ncbi:alpha-galactosidase [Vibrio sp. JCM 19052]|nr:alpha-galactosidase [Vibrio sp. JCM 19052]
MTDKTLIELTGQQTQLIVELGEYAEILHWGQKVSGDLSGFRMALHRPVPYGRLDSDVSMTLHPELGRGVFSSLVWKGIAMVKIGLQCLSSPILNNSKTVL